MAIGKSMQNADKRASLIAEIVARTGIDEAMIDSLVRSFYARVRKDALLGPVFETRIVDWEPHLQRMCAFWSSVALMSGRYHGQPMEKHLPLPVDARHFDRWLELFAQTANDLVPPAASKHFVERANTIARSLEMGIATRDGIFLKKEERLHRADDHITLPKPVDCETKVLA
jgi:hemoglobin